MNSKTLAMPPEHWSNRLRSRSLATKREGETSVANGRWANRKRVSINGYMRFARNDVPFGCNIVDISSTGALISISSNAKDVTVDDVPEELTLIFWQNRETTEVACSIARRFGNTLGVRFVGPFHTSVQPKRYLAMKPLGKSR